MFDSISNLAIVALCGAGTFLLRLLPMLRSTRKTTSLSVTRFTEAVGPAAIMALLTATLMPFFEPAASLHSYSKGIVTGISLLVTAVAHLRLRGIMAPTLCGVLSYGVLMGML